MTGTLAVHTLIISFGICICTPRLKKQSSIILKNKHKSHKQMNHKKTNRKVSLGKELKEKENTQTQHHNHNTRKKLNKGKPKKGWIRENTCRKTKEREGNNWTKHRECRKKRPTRPKGFCTGMQAQLHSPIMQQVLLFTRAGFPWQHVQESL